MGRVHLNPRTTTYRPYIRPTQLGQLHDADTYLQPVNCFNPEY